MSDTATQEHFEHPQPNDRFHEMYSAWVYILAVHEGGEVETVRFSGHPANPYKETIRKQVYPNVFAFRDDFRNQGIPGFYMAYCDNNPARVQVIREMMT